MMVRPEARGQGIGATLLEACIAEARRDRRLEMLTLTRHRRQRRARCASTSAPASSLRHAAPGDPLDDGRVPRQAAHGAGALSSACASGRRLDDARRVASRCQVSTTRVRVERDRHDAFVGQPLGEVGVVARALAADADVLAGARGRRRSRARSAPSPPGRARRSRRASSSRPESRSRPSVSWVRSLEPIDMPSKCSRNCSARMALLGTSHIMITRRPSLPRRPLQAVLGQHLDHPLGLAAACARTAP